MLEITLPLWPEMFLVIVSPLCGCLLDTKKVEMFIVCSQIFLIMHHYRRKNSMAALFMQYGAVLNVIMSSILHFKDWGSSYAILSKGRLQSAQLIWLIILRITFRKVPYSVGILEGLDGKSKYIYFQWMKILLICTFKVCISYFVWEQYNIS